MTQHNALANSTSSEHSVKWYDTVQEDVTETITDTANWFDGFFGQDQFDEDRASASARLRLSYIPIESNVARFENQFRVRARLPNLEDKWDVIVADYNDSNEAKESDRVISETEGQGKNEDVSVAVRYIHSQNKSKFISTRVGFAKGADIYIRTRYRRQFAITNKFNFEVEPALYYYLSNGIGARFNFKFDHQLSDHSLWRQDNSWEYIQDEQDPEWRHNLLLYHQLNSQSALISGIFAHGYINQGYHLENKGIFVRYRLQALRSWLFFEIEPFIHYPDYREFSQTPGIALRLEINFQQQ
ncbi:hypothetical protein [Catenovulum agarivorans]|uniref:hypothetical protein n=1 Tax=Catenovulum agarivorans TaxID=1172192 RepID=UPI0004B1A945|nr:hypothetical protein [Catenovulum agarivorans]